MKKLVLFTVLGLFLASCSSKFGLQKRRYNKGFYFSVSDKKHEGNNNTAKATTLKTKNEYKITTSINSDNEELLVSKNNEKHQLKQGVDENKNQKVASSKTKTEDARIVTSAKQNHNQLAYNKVNSKKVALFNVKQFKLLPNAVVKKGGSDTNTILLVILCLFWFLGLVAVYLHDGKSITLNFWIALLLYLTFILGVVFSILVVLDVINLA